MSTQKITIVGAGLAGSLLAILMAKRGFAIQLFEKRPDMRTTDISAGRSINLALSTRGIEALKRAGIASDIMQEAVPMHGRIVHSKDGEVSNHPYSGRAHHYINSISRGGLNKQLLDIAESYDNVDIFFNESCTGVDFNTSTATFYNRTNDTTTTVSSDIILATDGANSGVRTAMMDHAAKLRFSFSQNYLAHGYKELHIPPAENGGFRIEKNGLHIWPRGNFMLIALPNFDGSFTVTLFMPFEGENGFDNLDTAPKVETFFKEYFPDVIPHMPNYLEDFMNNPSSSLATVKCYPWQVNSKSLLIGDAAHAVVPFYGQGMNCSFEDCAEFDKYVEEYGTDWEKVFNAYQSERKANTDAIADLAEENYYEMRSHVADPVFVKKRWVEMALEKTDSSFYSKYSMVTFNHEIPYADAMNNGRAQDQLLMDICRQYDDITQANLDDIKKQL